MFSIIFTSSWKAIAERSFSWTLVLNHDNQVGKEEPWVEPLLESNRKFHKVIVNDLLELGRNKTLEVFQKHGENIRELCLFDCVFKNSSIFLQILKLMPHLKKLIMFGTAALADFNDPDNDFLPTLPKLKSMEFVKCEYRLLTFFKKAQLISFKVLSSIDERQSPEELLRLTEFLASQKQLSSLALRSFEQTNSQLFQTPLFEDEIPFHLKKLSLLGMKLRESPNDYNNLLKFMKLHVKTIELLEIGRKFPDFVFEFIFARLKNLKQLRLMVNELPKELEFYERLEENKSIKSLFITDSPTPDHTNEGFPWLSAFLQHMPNIESLTVPDYCRDKSTMEFVAANMKNLKYLSVKNFSGTVFNGLEFPSLISLKTVSIEGPIDWYAFTKATPQVANFYVEAIYDEESFDINAITENWKQLQTLVIECEVNGDENFFDSIRNNCSNLKSVDMEENSLRVELSDVVDIPLRLRESQLAKDDGAFWHASDYRGNDLPEDDDDDHNWNADMDDVLDPFDLELLMEDLDFGYDGHDDYDSDDDFYDRWNDHEDDYDVDEDSDYGRRCND